MKLLERYLKKELDVYLKNNIRFKAIGDLSRFSKSLQKTIFETQDKTANCSGLTQVLALNYGSKNEIIRAVKKLNELQLEVSEENLESCLDTAGMGDVDVLIRTSGEVRLSNYLLWQNAYAEMFFTQTYWPDFNESELDDILSDFSKRERRFGGI
jgi:undecaprenyl diphosphate synthase